MVRRSSQVAKMQKFGSGAMIKEVFAKTKSDMESKAIEPNQKVTNDSAAIKVWG